MRFVLSLVLATLAAGGAQARPMTTDEAAALEKALKSYGRVTEAKDAERIVATIPPHVVSIVAGTAGIEASKVAKTLVEQTKAAMAETAITGFVTAPGPYEAEDAVLEDGTGVIWVLVRAQFDAETAGKKTRNHQPLLAVQEGGQWYFSRIDGPQQQQILGLAYPFVAGARLPPSDSQPAP